MRNAILRNIQISQKQTLSKVDDRGSVDLGDTVHNSLLKAAEGKYNKLCDIGEGIVAPVVEE